MRVSVIISTFTLARLDDVKRCFASLERQTRPPDEVVLVLDPDPELVLGYRQALGEQAKIVISPHPGLSHARNSGIDSTTGDIVAFIDDDAFAEPQWLEMLLRAFNDEDVLAVGGRIDPAWDGGQPSWFPNEINWVVGCTYAGHRDDRGEIRNAIGANMAFRRTVCAIVPEGFRTDVGRQGAHLLGSEEMEYCIKIRDRKPTARIVYEPAAVVHHRVPRSRGTLKYVWKRAYGEGVSKKILKATTLQDSNRALQAEGHYLRYVAKHGLLGRIARPSPARLREAGTLVFAVAATAAGYIVGRRGE